MDTQDINQKLVTAGRLLREAIAAGDEPAVRNLRAQIRALNASHLRQGSGSEERLGRIAGFAGNGEGQAVDRLNRDRVKAGFAPLGEKEAMAELAAQKEEASLEAETTRLNGGEDSPEVLEALLVEAPARPERCITKAQLIRWLDSVCGSLLVMPDGDGVHCKVRFTTSWGWHLWVETPAAARALARLFGTEQKRAPTYPWLSAQLRAAKAAKAGR